MSNVLKHGNEQIGAMVRDAFAGYSRERRKTLFEYALHVATDDEAPGVLRDICGLAALKIGELLEAEQESGECP